MRILLLVLFPFHVWAQSSSVCPGATGEYFRYVVETLANDSMKGRLPGTPEEKIAADFIATELKKSGAKPLKRKRFLFPFDYTGPDSTLVHSSGNVIGKINTKSTQCIIVTAHYDHIGFGYHHSNDPFNHSVYNGADDNASGVAMLLALASWCKEHQSQLKYDIVFAAVSGEEDGLFGSEEFLRSGLVDTSLMICNINFDMVGNLDQIRPLLIAEGANESSFWNGFLPKDTTGNFTVQRTNVILVGGSDHYSFIQRKIPAVLLTTGNSKQYHRPGDDPDTINYKGMVAIAHYVEDLLLNINKSSTKK